MLATLIGYVLATFFRLREKVAGRSFRHHSTFSLALGLTCNAILTFRAFTLSDGGFHYQAVFLAGALGLGICTAIIEHGLKETFFSIFSLPASVVMLFCSTFADGILTGGQFSQRWFAVHLLLSILGECFFFIAAISSAVYFYVVRRLKKKNRLRALAIFPPMARLDDLTFKLIGAGTLVFSGGLAAGFYGNYSYFISFSPGSKHIYAVLLLAFYLIVLLGRKGLKLSGTRLATMAIIGFILSFGLVTLPDNSEHWQPLHKTTQEAAR
ncbi:MAG TPA: cytochrome c biogenesis protein CcsA [Candidatus Rifleibacterium sp.]|nr:cytochrome c biogenesis protein CcsA [Candidatus Rifleibacterium sp.]HPT45327.1 cytochrome c biogenesis protein CcsA [Candidatus Rifleibacterium sp.]